MQTKLCRRCQKLKPTVDFQQNVRRADGLQIYCRECMNDLNQRRRKKLDKETLRDMWRRHKKQWRERQKAETPKSASP